jgi:hypothetical protein
VTGALVNIGTITGSTATAANGTTLALTLTLIIVNPNVSACPLSFAATVGFNGLAGTIATVNCPTPATTTFEAIVEPLPQNVPISSTGTISDGIAGNSPMTLTLAQKGAYAIGTYTTTLSGGIGSAGQFAGALNDSGVYFDLLPQFGGSCATFTGNAQLLPLGNAISGPYSSFACTVTDSGIFTVQPPL